MPLFLYGEIVVFVMYMTMLSAYVAATLSALRSMLKNITLGALLGVWRKLGHFVGVC